MVHDSLLNAYIFDFLKKRGYLQTALLFADECKGLPLAEATSEDPAVDMPAGLVASTSPVVASQMKPSADSPPHASDAAANASTTDETKPQKYQVPSVIIPHNSPNGFLLEWWSVFWDVFAASSGRPSAGVSDGIRAYTQHQVDRRNPKPANGKRMASSDAGPAGNGGRGATADGAPPAKRSRVGDRSPQSEALIDRYSQTDDIEALRLPAADQQHALANGKAGPTIPLGPGVNISLAGTHVLSDDYPDFLSRSRKVMAENAQSATRAQQDNQPNVSRGAEARASAASAVSQASAPEQTTQQAGPAATTAAVSRAGPAFASPRMASSTPRPVPTQRAISQQAANSMAANPMASNPMAANPMATNVSAANIQAMQRLMSPPPAHAQMAQPPPLPSQQPAPLTSPMVTNASLAATDLRRASVASGPYSAPHPQQQQQQHPGTLTHVATTGPQLPSTVRQQTMPAAMGMSAAELGLHNTTMAMAAATAGLNGRTPNQAMFAYVQHQQQQQQQMAAHLGAFGQGGMGQGLPPQIPRPQTTVGAGASEAGHMAGPMLGGMPGMGAPDAMASGNPGLHQPTPQTAVGFQPGMSMADARQQYMLLHMQGAHPAGSPHVAAGIPQALQQHPHALMAGSATPPVPHKRPDAGPMDASMAGAQPLPPKKAPKAKVRRTKKNGKASATPSEGVAVRKADNGSPAAAKSAGQSPPFLGGLGAESGGMGLGDPSALTALLARGSTGDLASAISAMGAPIDPSLGLNINDLLGGSSEALNDILNMDAMGDSSGSGISSQVLDAYSMGGDALTSLLATSGVNAINALPMAAGLASTGAPPAPTADAVFSPAAASGHNM